MSDRGLRATGGLFGVVTWAFLGACGSPAPQAKAPAVAPTAGGDVTPPEPPDGPVPELRVGAVAPIDHPEPLAAHVARRFVDATLETLMVVIDDPAAVPMATTMPQSFVVAVGDELQLFPFASSERPTPAGPAIVVLWIRRPAAAAGTTVEGDLFTPFALGGGAGDTAGGRFHFRSDDPATNRSDATLVPEWERKLADHLQGERWGAPRDPWWTFAMLKLRELAPLEVKAAPKKPAAHPPPRGRPTPAFRPIAPPPRRSSDELARLMETTTGAVAVQEALQNERALFLSAAREKPTIALSTVKGPELARHPWTEMLAKLGAAAPAEPLAQAAPAEVDDARAASLPVLLRLLDQVDAWGTPASHALGGQTEDYQLAARYEAQLGLKRGPLTRSLGPSVIADVAIVGSDPYLKEGSDVTLVFRVKQKALFDAGLQVSMTEHEKAHGTITTTQESLAGTNVSVAQSADGAVRQHRATVGDLELVSNSAAALTRVLETLQGKHARLSDEKDFKYMLARDASTPSDVLAYMSDRFVAEVVGPRQKIAEARREIAMAELMTPGFAALLYGVIHGKSPSSVADLEKERLLAPSEMAHASGGAITWTPGEAAHSAWGTPASLTPLIDLPSPDLVTASEQSGYDRFSRSYQADWSHYIDPVAIRLAFEDLTVAGAKSTRMTVDLRELPLLDQSEYRDLGSEVGDARFETGPVGDGARVVAALGERSEVRKLATRFGSFSSHHELKFDWIGDWAMLGVLDRSQIAVAALALAEDDIPQKPADDGKSHASKDDFVQQLTQLPLYAAIAVKNPLGATLALAGLRALAEESTPGVLEWGESAKYKGVPIVRVGVNGKRAREEFGQEVTVQIFYAVTQGAILVTFSEATLRHLIDDRQAGRAPKAPSARTGGEQFSLELASDKGRALWSVIMWAFEREALRDDSGRSRLMAEALLRGAPERSKDPAAVRALALAYFGCVPLTVDGGAFTLTREGVKDPVRGTAYAPSWPPLPVAGSPVGALMTALAHARGDLSFDDEGQIGKGPPMRSLHAKVTVDLRD